MAQKPYKIIAIDEPGEYCLVPKAEADSINHLPQSGGPLISVLTFGALVKLHREAAGLTLRQLATQMGRSDHKHIGEIERGEAKRPRPQYVVDFITAFGPAFAEDLRRSRLSDLFNDTE